MAYVQIERRDCFSILSIHRPEALNALNRAVVDEIDEFLDQVAADTSQRVLLLYSEGNFAAGADIKQMADCNVEEARAFGFGPTFNKLADLPIPTVALMDGFALGGGLELALCCDIRIASETAKMGFPEINLGIMPGAGGTIRAPRLIGEGRAKELIYTGRSVGADEALGMGLINDVVPAAELLERGVKLAEKLSGKAATALEAAKRTITEGMAEADMRAAVERIEGPNWAKLFDTEEQKEGMRAFLEKRKPVYGENRGGRHHA